MRGFIKYKAKKVEYDGKVFDSKGECERYKELRLLEEAGEIMRLRTQVRFKLLETQFENPEKRRGLIIKGCDYIADFVYLTKDFRLVVEDHKGFKTKDYLVKKKWMYDKYGILIKESGGKNASKKNVRVRKVS